MPLITVLSPLLAARKLLAKWRGQDTREDPSSEDAGLASHGVARDTVADPLRPADDGTATPPGQPAGSFTIYSLPRVFGD